MKQNIFNYLPKSAFKTKVLLSYFLHYTTLLQQLYCFKINRNETILKSVDRHKAFTHRIISKIHYEIVDSGSRIPLINQVQITAVLVLTSNSPPGLN